MEGAGGEGVRRKGAGGREWGKWYGLMETDRSEMGEEGDGGGCAARVNAGVGRGGETEPEERGSESGVQGAEDLLYSTRAAPNLVPPCRRDGTGGFLLALRNPEPEHTHFLCSTFLFFFSWIFTLHRS